MLKSVTVCDRPEQVVAGPKGSVFVTCRGDGTVVALDADLAQVSAQEIGVEPFGLALSRRGGTVFVTTAGDAKLHALDAKTLEAKWSAELPDHPRGVAISPDGKRAVVAHLVGGKVSVVSARSGRVRGAKLPTKRDGWPSELADFFDESALKVRAAGGAYAVAMSPGGTRAFVPYVLKNPGEPIEDQNTGCYSNGADLPVAMSVGSVDLKKRKVRRPKLKNIPEDEQTEETDFWSIDRMAELGVVRAAVHDPKRSRLLVVGEGSGVLMTFDTSKADPTSKPLAGWRLESPARGLAVNAGGTRAFVHLDLDHQVAVVDLSDREAEPVKVALRDDREETEVEVGRRLFYASNNTQVTSIPGVGCTSCHMEGRSDGVTWTLGKRSLQTPQLSGRLDGHGPLRWGGDSPDVGHAVGEAITRLGGDGLPAAAANAMVAYLKSTSAEMVLPENPHESTDKGREVFEKAGCDNCHDPEESYSDGLKHTFRGEDVRTPSLLGVYGTAPYYHDGSAPTLEQLVSAHEKDNPMAAGNKLTKAELVDLVAFLKSL